MRLLAEALTHSPDDHSLLVELGVLHYVMAARANEIQLGTAGGVL
jgi:hypothetical protein